MVTVSGAAAAIPVCDRPVSSSALTGRPGTYPPNAAQSAPRIHATVITGGKYRPVDEPGLSQLAAQRVYAMTSITPQR